MDDRLFETGLERRRSTLGAEYVDKVMDGADEFSRPFQEAMTAWCWGFGWGDDVLPAKTRSMVNLPMLAALNRMEEFELHFRGAIRNGVSRDELRALLHVIAIYCGVPAAVASFRIARKVLAEEG
jgi:4-carboxymuconolactone decarboxylase